MALPLAEAFVQFRGAKSRQLKSQLASDGFVVRVPPSDDQPAFEIKVVNSYKHMGSILAADASPAREVAYRAATCSSALAPLRTMHSWSAEFATIIIDPYAPQFTFVGAYNLFPARCS